MKKTFLLIFLIVSGVALFAQDEPQTFSSSKPRTISKANDHFLIQVGYTGWPGIPDSIHTKGFSRSFNMYLMYNFPFKSNPHLSVGLGIGIGTDNIYFSKTYVGLKDLTSTLRFQDLTDTNHFKKYKLAAAWLEAPLELRYSSNPSNPNKSYKAAIGLKFGTLLNAHTKGKNLLNKGGGLVLPYTEKQTSKRFYNTTRISATARFGIGVFSIFGSYQLNSLFKEGYAPDIRPYTIGFTLSGL